MKVHHSKLQVVATASTEQNAFSLYCQIAFFLLVFISFTPQYVFAVSQSVKSQTQVRPFRDIGATLGFRGDHHEVINGVTLFDANGDGLQDIYLTHDGRPLHKLTTNDGVLTENRVPALPNTLFLNQGNDANGNPIYMPIQELAKNNNQYVKEELLIENKYRPRASLADNEFTVGRIARAAVSADFNGDGRMDLYIANSHHGLGAQTEETGVPIYSAQDNLGRNESRLKKPIIIRAPPFIAPEKMEDGLNVRVNFGEEPEWEGRNMLFLNVGDKDGDGLPEWQDYTEQAGVGGKWDSTGLAVADVDRDGDLDIYVANFLDSDFLGFGMNRFAGNRNQLYLNQLAESGNLTFKDVALDMKVSGLHREENLPNGMYFPTLGKVVSVSKQYVNGKVVGEEADHSFAAQFTDWNDDGWPDLAVANDIGGTRLRVYKNKKGKTFDRIKKFDGPQWEGCWMGIDSGDLDGDGQMEMLVVSCGSQTLSLRNTAIFINTSEEINTQALSQINYPDKRSTLHHVLLSYQNQSLKDVTFDTQVNYSTVLPPDMTNPNNVSHKHHQFFQEARLANSITGVELSWGPILFDLDNDSDLDIYFLGALGKGNDGLFGDFSGPGRLLINESKPGSFVFNEKTIEYRLLDIRHMEYDSQPPRRRSPGSGWHKRDYIYVSDTDSFSEMGFEASDKSVIYDLSRMHEWAMGMVTGDLNNDGFPDLIVTHACSYTSLSPEATNLKINMDGQVRALPGTDKLKKPPTNYDAGKTSVYINGGASEGTDPNWVKIRLLDRNSNNIYAVGSKVILNDKLIRHINVGGPAYSAYSGDLLVGLGENKLKNIKIRWPSGSLKLQEIEIDQPIAKQLICVDRDKGIVNCNMSMAFFNGR